MTADQKEFLISPPSKSVLIFQPCSRRPDGMVRRFSAFSVFLVGSVFLLILFVSHRLVISGTLEESSFQGIGRTIQSWSVNDIDRPDLSHFDDNVTADIHAAVAEQRRLIADEMADYNFPNGRYNITAKSMADLVPEQGGQPLRNIIVTTWRSGSTFLGDILNSHPGNYYHYEPLLDYDIVQIRGPPHAKASVGVLRNLLNCNYTHLERYLEYGKTHSWLFSHNTRLWEHCQEHPNICWLPQFLNPFCRVFPFQSMKVVRLRLSLFEELLADKRLNIRVLLLVRDPRGTLQSRKHRDWCPNNADCDRPELLCADLVADYAAATRIAQAHPTRFAAMRYEDLALDPYAAAKRIFEFYGLDFHPSVIKFLDTHTKVDVGGVSSTFRNSKSTAFHWRQDLSHREVHMIQQHCGRAMKHWGYVKAVNRTHQLDFRPIVPFSLS